MPAIKVTHDRKICTITLSRPRARNSWTEVMRAEIVDALDAASRDANVRCVVITGDPAGKAFCAGADLSGGGEKAFGGDAAVMPGDVPVGRPVNNSTFRDGGGTAGLAVVRCTKPTICAINGHAVGVGITFPLVCDIRIASEDAKIGFVFSKRGLCMETLSSFYLPRVVGLAKASELVYTGRVFSAKDAHVEAPGLFNHVVPQDQVLPKAYEIAREIADNTSAMSVVLSRFMMQRALYDTSPEQAHLIESRGVHFMSTTKDNQEGVDSFLEKRPAQFTMDPFRDLPDFFPWWSWHTTHNAKL